ncbi:hypothetical protein U1Q18_039895, partial [Sarracenia purpurea var. burkii]
MFLIFILESENTKCSGIHRASTGDLQSSSSTNSGAIRTIPASPSIVPPTTAPPSVPTHRLDPP